LLIFAGIESYLLVDTMSSNNVQRRWKTLLHKVGYLRLEVEDKKEILQGAESEFNNVYSDMARRHPDPDDPDSLPKESNSSAELQVEINDMRQPPLQDELPPPQDPDSFEEVKSNDSLGEQEDFKKIWKLIAAKTHPDISKDLDLIDTYKRALDAWNNGRYEVLLDIVSELSIKMPQPSEGMLTALEARAAVLQDELKKFEGSVLWDWMHAPVDKKDVIVEQLLKFRRKRRKK
jgi:hypothetical protein